MKRALQTIGCAVLALLLSVTFGTVSVKAAETLDVEIPFSVVLEGAVPEEAETHSAHLQAKEETSPMPEGAIEGIYTLEVTGDGEFHFPAITYNRVGIYQYTLWMSAGENPFAIYDETVFDVTVYITNAEDGSGLTSTVIAYPQVEDAEKSPIEFCIFYKTPAEVTVVKKWADDGKNRPDSVKVQLLCDNEVVETVTLNESNAWQYSWKMLLPDYEWTVKEIEIPAGYTESYSEKDQVVTITNTKALLQTGQLNWPIPLLVIAGTAFIGIGTYLKKKETDHA